jgi:hypothetical protein
MVGPLQRLVELDKHLVDSGDVTVTATWLDKSDYLSNGGPYLTGEPGDTSKFRNFQIRRLLEHHVTRQPWGPVTELVIDRWDMTEERRQNFERYIGGNFNLRPKPRITFVDSIYCDPIQIADLLGRRLRRRVTNSCDDEEAARCDSLMSIQQVSRRLF